uniref:Uncharacterized protein n=1 Tax=Attheya septentrionalis TaxID=420275 RepID=A0A7S2U9U0_9STRA|mmetsp:Transcript_16645/g.30272  ORF Transcript_16645/g.30272 Transcript_16645/m.30272 type:complete len:435 (+) Transcript_16645:109-1413(+)
MPSLVNKITKRLRRKEKKSDDVPAPFPILNLSDDLILHVLSFVSSAPFESNDEEQSLFKAYMSYETKKIHQASTSSPFLSAAMSYQVYRAALETCASDLKLTLITFGTLTHVLPLVCKRFQILCQLSDLWKEAIDRLIVVYPSIWGKGIRSLCKEQRSNDMDICLRASELCGGSRRAFQRVVEVCQPFITVLPVLVLGDNRSDPPVLGQVWNLHLVKPQYQLMTAEIMESYPLHYQRESPIASQGRPRFLFSSGLSLPLVGGDPVFVVEITRCKLKRDGTIRLSIVAVLQTTMLSIQVRPNAFGLLDAKVQTKKTLSEGRMRLPVFTSVAASTQHTTPLFCSIEVTFGEGRYRRMIRELMADETVDRPKFIFSSMDTVTSGEMAILSEVRKCVIHADGTADVEFVGIAQGTLQEVVERPDSSGIIDATFILSQN